ncbi:hypothetical protein CVD28_02300 [Bacillus sp. M6-12]|uniref:zinc-ribbon domain-containing protein n=1 Tax=Bacillus sp. M6-12 TaxID=2054166 RepID=UPI000C75C90D|nr:zinc-ribbon domain-containing protein [Bacillus sp. M6-12]PLS19264.1 hypothetical protein CVD28_02300 [Bacillus sp. M6-12]
MHEVKLEDSLAYKRPDLVKEWDFDKNGDLTPLNVTYGSGKKAWWVCEKGHEWKAQINSRFQKSGCPHCLKKRATNETSLAKNYPELAKEWHPTKNSYKPEDYRCRSHQKVWWKCKHGHEWEARIYSRVDGRNCPICNLGKQTSFPEQVIYFYLKQYFPDAINRYKDKEHPYELDIFIPSLKLGIEYDGDAYHKDLTKDITKNLYFKEKMIDLVRIREKKCPILTDNNSVIYILPDKKETTLIEALKYIFCFINKKYNPSLDLCVNKILFDISNDRVQIYEQLDRGKYENSIEVINPELIKEWHPTKNGSIKPSGISPYSNKILWWKCEKGHEWQSLVGNRTQGNGCPYCAGQKVCDDNCLETLKPELAKEWHPTKNEKLTTKQVTCGTNKKVWWLCEKGHEWKASVYTRSKNIGCPQCSGRDASPENNLLSKNPLLASQWHPTKNKNAPDKYTKSSGKKVWWLCEKGHEWEASIDNRRGGRGCPYCSGKRVNIENCLATLKPELAKEWHPTKNGDITPYKVTSGSNKKVWWLGKCGHEWDAFIGNRVKGRGCPYCSGNKVNAENCLATIRPELIEEWHPTKNGDITPYKVTSGTNRKVWWLCSNGHEWETGIVHRKNGSACPICVRKKTKD